MSQVSSLGFSSGLQSYYDESGFFIQSESLAPNPAPPAYPNHAWTFDESNQPAVLTPAPAPAPPPAAAAPAPAVPSYTITNATSFAPHFDESGIIYDESGVASAPASPAPRIPLPSIITTPASTATAIPLSHQRQQEQNACGTTALSMIMTYFGHPVSPAEIDNSIRRRDVGTPPSLIVEYAQNNGFAAGQYNDGSWEAMKGYIDQGIPCMALIEPGTPNDLVAHYVNVVGYETTTDGRLNVILDDPSRSNRTSLPLESFLAKWDSIKMLNLNTGYHNFFMVVAPGGVALPPSNIDDATAFAVLSEGSAQIVNGWDLATGSGNSAGERLIGIGGIAAGSIAVAGSVPAYIDSLLGDAVGGDFGELITRIGASNAALANTLAHLVQNTTQTVVTVGEDIEALTGDLLSLDLDAAFHDAEKLTRDLISGVIDTFENIFEGIFDVFEDIFDFFSDIF
jgi:Peptidase C39 family